MTSHRRRPCAFALLCTLPLAALAGNGPPFPFDVNVVNPVLPVEVRLLVRDVGAPAALEPVRVSTYFNDSDFSNPTKHLLTTVPANRRLIVEHVSWDAGTTADGSIRRVSLRVGVDGPTVSVFKIGSNGPQDFIGAAPVRLYFEPGEEVWIAVTNSGTAFAFRVYMHGHLVPL